MTKDQQVRNRRHWEAHLPYLRNDDPYFTHRELQRILYGKENKDLVM